MLYAYNHCYLSTVFVWLYTFFIFSTSMKPYSDLKFIRHDEAFSKETSISFLIYILISDELYEIGTIQKKNNHKYFITYININIFNRS